MPRFTKKTIDNWESYIVDNYTGKEYGYDIDETIELLNNVQLETETWENMKFKIEDDKLQIICEDINIGVEMQYVDDISPNELFELFINAMKMIKRGIIGYYVYLHINQKVNNGGE